MAMVITTARRVAATETSDGVLHYVVALDDTQMIDDPENEGSQIIDPNWLYTQDYGYAGQREDEPTDEFETRFLEFEAGAQIDLVKSAELALAQKHPDGGAPLESEGTVIG